MKLTTSELRKIIREEIRKVSIGEAARTEAKEFYKKVREMTDDNNHSEAALELAKFMKDKSATEKLQTILSNHMRRGHLIQKDAAERSKITDALLSAAKKKFSKEDYNFITRAF